MSILHRISARPAPPPEPVASDASAVAWDGRFPWSPPRPLMRCTGCAVTWCGAEPCWMCGAPGENI